MFTLSVPPNAVERLPEFFMNGNMQQDHKISVQLPNHHHVSPNIMTACDGCCSNLQAFLLLKRFNTLSLL